METDTVITEKNTAHYKRYSDIEYTRIQDSTMLSTYRQHSIIAFISCLLFICVFILLHIGGLEKAVDKIIYLALVFLAISMQISIGLGVMTPPTTEWMDDKCKKHCDLMGQLSYMFNMLAQLCLLISILPTFISYKA